MDCDVLVVGAGNAALAAAVAAREQGARRVVVLEKAPRELRGGNTHYSGGLLRFAFDAAEQLRPIVPDAERRLRGFMSGVEPYPAKLFLADLQRVTEGRTDPELAEILIGRSYDLPKSNWAQALDTPPFVAYPVTGGITFTFGGVRINDRAQVMRDPSRTNRERLLEVGAKERHDFADAVRPGGRLAAGRGPVPGG
jgi:glycine/D-amino acid oxidase-like deaminating enzyme